MHNDFLSGKKDNLLWICFYLFSASKQVKKVNINAARPAYRGSFRELDLCFVLPLELAARNSTLQGEQLALQWEFGFGGSGELR